MDAPYQDQAASLVTGLDHYTLRCREDEIDVLRDFYAAVLGLTAGPRPDFSFPGHWLYAGGWPIVHIAGRVPPGTPDGAPGQTGRLDHISFLGTDVATVEAHLHARGIEFQGTPVPGFPLYQLFFHDPVGMKVELTFRV